MMKRLSICFAAPGHSLLPTSGTTRNMLAIAKALSRRADVTVAFRTIHEPMEFENLKTVAIEPGARTKLELKDDIAARGLNVFAHLSYLKKLAQFCRSSAGCYDLVFEKGWRLSGYLSYEFCRNGVPAVLVENDIRHWSESLNNATAVARFGAHWAAQRLARFYSRRIPSIIAETDELRDMLVRERHISARRIETVELGVDHALFRPLDRRSCRSLLGLQSDRFILLYVGGLDTYHDLAPVIDAITRAPTPSIELHIVGDGEYRSLYEQQAANSGQPISFHGAAPHDRIPIFIGAADLCLAPYRASAFPNQSVSFSTLKIPEYMACGRAVASVPSGHITTLIEDRVSGFLFSNDVNSWVNFLKNLPSKERLQKIGDAAGRAVGSLSWEHTAERYLEIGQSLMTKREAAPLEEVPNKLRGEV